MKLGTIVLMTAALMMFCGCDTTHDSAWHWARIKQYNEYIHDPKNLKQDNVGRYLDNVPDIMPSLYALERKGEITYVDLVFPNVPASREVTKYWMEYCEKTPDIVYATANPSCGEYHTSGIQPFHMNIWGRTTARGRIKELIEGVEGFGKTETPSNKPDAGDSQ